mmetsp:Transcript_25210/g.58533  ORF Transcript_25210/g.58533 Transcript_25210/m.58533 type:complete len:143 (+) Transcript_25210:53-481(+)
MDMIPVREFKPGSGQKPLGDTSACRARFVEHVRSDWVTYYRKNLNASAVASGKKPWTGTRVAVLIGSLLRFGDHPVYLDHLFKEDVQLEWWIFIATAGTQTTPGCFLDICNFEHLASLSFVDMHPSSQRAEDEFAYRSLNGF